MKAQKVALVTSSSSRIGLETVFLLARNGFHTYASMRNLEKSKNITQLANKEKLPLQVSSSIFIFPTFRKHLVKEKSIFFS